MHAFDTSREKTSSSARFAQLLKELESPPRVEDFSRMLASEYDAEWMALVTLCPPSLRDPLVAILDAKEISPLQAAEELRVPQDVIQAVSGNYYHDVLAELLDH